MREIKFRIWDKWRKRMFVWDNLSDHCIPSNYKDCFEIMQFTGITDYHGQDVYEGDICSDGNGSYGVIEWVQDHCQFLWVCDEETQELWEDMEVIGNIYQNPELLKL